jgi:hypothetical protein
LVIGVDGSDGIRYDVWLLGIGLPKKKERAAEAALSKHECPF